MSFSTVHMLWLVWVLPVLFLVILWGLRKRKKILTAYATEKGLSAISPNVSGFRRWLKAMILLFVILLTVVSLAGPQYGYSWKKTEHRGVDLIVALDCSRSMLAQDIQPTRLERAKREVLDLLGMIQGDRVGLVAFAGTAFLQCPLTLDYAGFNIFLSALHPDFLPVGGTDLAAAITTAVSAFNKDDATDKAVILITDGESTGADPLDAARKAAEAGIKVFCIGVGGADGVPIPAAGGGFIKDRNGNIMLSKLDEPTLKQIAAITSGAYVRSLAGDMDLDVIYHQHIRGGMKSASLGEQRIKVFENRYQWVLGLGVFLFLLELLLPVKKTTAVWVLVIIAALAPRDASATNLKKVLKQADAAYTSGDYDKAAQNYVSAQLEAPEKPEISFDLGNARYKSKNYDSAVKAYTQVLKTKNPKLKHKALYNLGNTFFRKGDLDKAIENYEAALKLDNTDNQARENLDFVKKLKNNPPPKTSRDQQSRKDQKKGKDRKDEKNGNQGEKSSDKRKENAENPQNESDNKDSQNKKEKQPTPSQEQKQASAPEQNGSANQSAEKKEAPASDEESVRQAEAMLNRLQDQPGRAMMPAYRKQRVDKDW